MSIILYLICLQFYAFCTEIDRCFGEKSWSVLLIGGLSIAGSWANFTWMANPAIFSAWYFIIKNNKGKAKKFSVIAIFLAFSFLFVTEVMVNESGAPTKILRVETGYWLWLASMVLSLAASLFMENTKSQPE